MHRSLACVRREPGERASGTCSPCTAAPAPLAYSCIATAALPSYRQQACPPQRLQTLPSAFGLLLQRSLACVRREPGERALERAARAPMGFQKRRYAFCTAFKPSSPATSNPSQRLWPTPASQPCLRQAGAWGESPGTCSPCSYGLPKATLGILHRLQTLPRGCKPSPAPLAYSCTAALPSSSSRQLAGLPLLFLWASKSDVRHFAPPLNPPRAFKPFPAPLAYSCIAALPCLCVRREPGERASGNVHRSLACVRREPGERASGTCSPCTAAPAPLAYSCIATAALPSYRQQACPPQRLQTLPSAFGLLLQRSLACVRREPGERALERAARAPMGFQKRR